MPRSASRNNSGPRNAGPTTPTRSRTNSSNAAGSRLSAMESLRQNLAANALSPDVSLDRKGKRKQGAVKLEEAEEQEPPSSPRRRTVKMEETDERPAMVVGYSAEYETQDVKLEDESSPRRKSNVLSSRARSASPSKRKRKANEEARELHIPPSPRFQTIKMEESEVAVPSSNASVRRRGGLLTPHPSVGDALDGELANGNVVKEELMESLPLLETPPRRSHSKPARTLVQSVSASIAIQTSRTPSRSSDSISSLTQRLRESSRRGLFVSPTQSPSGSVVRKSSFIRLGEKEAGSIADDLVSLAKERERLEKELEAVKQAEAELLSMFAGGPASLRSSIDLDELDANTVRAANDRQSRSEFLERGSPSKRIKLHEEQVLVNLSPSADKSRTSNDTESSFSNGRSKASYAYAMNPSDISSSSRPSARSPASVSRSHLSESTYMSAPESLSWSQHRDPLWDSSGDSYFVFFDLETNDAVRAVQKIRILEVAVRITDKNFIPLDGGLTFLVHWPLTVDELKAEMPKAVEEMHEKSGLLNAYANTPPSERLTLKDVEKRVCRYLRKHQISRGILAGAGIAFDRGMVRQHMEQLDRLLGHQIFDTTSLWHLIRRKYNRSKRFASSCAHRAMDDINGAIREARVYSEIVMRAPNDVQWPNNQDGV